MLKDTKGFSGFSVDDLDAARRFYGETLGLDVSQENEMLLRLLISGDHPVLIYAKPDHRPATFTILNFPVADIEASVAELTDRGVAFEHYEGTDLATDERGVFRGPGPTIAWFKDPAGNVLSLIQDEG